MFNRENKHDTETNVTMVTYSTSKFQDKVCYGVGSVQDTMIHCNVIFIIAISMNRFIRCLRPMQMSVMTKNQTCLCLVLFWGVALSPSIIKLVFQSMGILPLYRWDSKIVKCVLDLASGWKEYNLAVILASFSLITLTNFGLFFISMDRNHQLLTKKMKRIKLQSFLITGGISSIFLISWLPSVIRTTLQHRGGQIPVWLEYLTHLYILNTFSNPIFYLFVNAGYCNFVHFKIKILKIKTIQLFLSVFFINDN